MRVKKAFVFLLLFLMLASALGCNGLPPVQTGVLDETVTFEDLNIKGEITFTISNESGTRVESMAPRALAKAFENAYPGTIVKIDESSRSTYENRILGGTIGDVFWCDSDDAVRYKTEHSSLMPLDYYIKPLGVNWNDVFLGSSGAGMIDGMFFMVPRELSQQALMYNKDALVEAGLEVPTDRAMTYDEWKNMCIQLTVESDTGAAYTQVGAQLHVGWERTWISFAEGWGGVWCDAEEKKISINSDTNVVKGLTELVNACMTGWLYPVDFGGSLAADYKSKYSGLSSTDYVFQQMGHMQWLTRLRSSYDSAALDWDFTYWPEFPTHVVCTEATGYVVYNRTTNKDTAAALALYFLTPDGQREYHSQTGGSVPALSSVSSGDFWRFPDDEVLSEKNWEVFVAYPDCTIQGNSVVRMPREISNLFSGTSMSNVFVKVLNGRTSLDTALAEIEVKANELWSRLD